MTATGLYNLKNYAYKNKQMLTIVLFTLILIVVVLILTIYSNDLGIHPPVTRSMVNLPPPRTGYGPYGYGLYLPPAAMIAQSLAQS